MRHAEWPNPFWNGKNSQLRTRTSALKPSSHMLPSLIKGGTLEPPARFKGGPGAKRAREWDCLKHCQWPYSNSPRAVCTTCLRSSCTAREAVRREKMLTCRECFERSESARRQRCAEGTRERGCFSLGSSTFDAKPAAKKVRSQRVHLLRSFAFFESK